jgi:hypothetical protein
MPKLVAKISAAVLIGLLFALCIPSAHARDGYYIEFRAAEVGIYGHSYIAYGRLDDKGAVATVHYTDFHPQSGLLRKVAGFVLPVDGDLTPERDTLSLPVLARYRRTLDAAEFHKFTVELQRARADTHLWNALANNCNYYTARMARSIGLATPNPLLFADRFVRALHELNDSPANIPRASAIAAHQGHTHNL